jgi:adenine-specific DNA methylase
MRNRLPKRSLLDEGDVPFIGLARLAYRESVRPRDVYQSHKWFARRLAVTARALLIAAATPAGGSFWKSYYTAPSYKGIDVLDPFLGGGVMVLEASRLGANVHGLDVEPVATAISSFQGKLRSLPALEAALDKLCTDVGGRLAPFYRAQNRSGEDEILLHAFWVQSVACRNCGHGFHAHPKFKLGSDPRIGRQWIACRACSNILQTKIGAKTSGCRCSVRTQAERGHVDAGTAVCPCCGHRQRLIDEAALAGKPPSFELFAVETIPTGNERRYQGNERTIRTATDFDRQMFADAAKALVALRADKPAFLPPSPIPREGRLDDRLFRYGYQNYSELFAARQQLHLGLLAEAIESLEGDVREAFSIAFSDHLTTNNLLCGYAGDWRRLSPLFSIRAFRHIARPVEINPWLRKNGRGTFPNAVRAIQRASKALLAPQEPTRAGTVRPVQDQASGSWDLRRADAQNIAHLADASIGLVLTDPPYFDYISYSELGHFFVPWMARFGLIDGSCLASFPADQLAAISKSPDAAERFTDGMTRAFKEIRRVCKEDARIVFTYQNLDGRGWEALAKAMSESGVVPIKTFPLLGDCGTRLHRRERSISWDAIVVCKAGEANSWIAPPDLIAQATTKLPRQWSKKVLTAGLDFSESDATNMSFAESIVIAARTGTKQTAARERPRRAAQS